MQALADELAFWRAAWGLPLYDVNIALGNLVDLVRQQKAAFSECPETASGRVSIELGYGRALPDSGPNTGEAGS